MYVPYNRRRLLGKRLFLRGSFAKVTQMSVPSDGMCDRAGIETKATYAPSKCSSLLKKRPIFIGFVCKSDIGKCEKY